MLPTVRPRKLPTLEGSVEHSNSYHANQNTRETALKISSALIFSNNGFPAACRHEKVFPTMIIVGLPDAAVRESSQR